MAIDLTNEFVTSELKMVKRRKRNKIFLGIFLFIALVTVALKVVDEILLDLGLHGGSFHLGFWNDDNFRKEAYGGAGTADDNISMVKQIERHPNFFWPLTQFTWITTFIIILFMVFRFFKYDQRSLPRWIKWIMTQRTISLLAMYDFIVGAIFWSSMFKGFANAFNDDLYWLEFIDTVLVHSVIPILTASYSIIYLLRDKRASILKEMFVVKGMIYPTLYIIYYVLIAVIWTDPYPISDLHNNFIGHIWKLPIALIGIYSLLGFMIMFHNWALLRYNKSYNPKKDYEIIMRKELKIEKIQRKLIRKYAKKHHE